MRTFGILVRERRVGQSIPFTITSKRIFCTIFPQGAKMALGMLN